MRVYWTTLTVARWAGRVSYSSIALIDGKVRWNTDEHTTAFPHSDRLYFQWHGRKLCSSDTSETDRKTYGKTLASKLWLTSILSRGGRNNPSRFMLQKSKLWGSSVEQGSSRQVLQLTHKLIVQKTISFPSVYFNVNKSTIELQNVTTNIEFV